MRVVFLWSNAQTTTMLWSYAEKIIPIKFLSVLFGNGYDCEIDLESLTRQKAIMNCSELLMVASETYRWLTYLLKWKINLQSICEFRLKNVITSMSFTLIHIETRLFFFELHCEKQPNEHSTNRRSHGKFNLITRAAYLVFFNHDILLCCNDYSCLFRFWLLHQLSFSL